jgi:DNA integrity scanning protein DisA with diadenylate cyclase activity
VGIADGNRYKTLKEIDATNAEIAVAETAVSQLEILISNIFSLQTAYPVHKALYRAMAVSGTSHNAKAVQDEVSSIIKNFNELLNDGDYKGKLTRRELQVALILLSERQNKQIIEQKKLGHLNIPTDYQL